MTRAHVHLHLYPQAQIKSRLRGHLVYVLEVPQDPGQPVLRQIYDATGREFPRLPGVKSFSIAARHMDCVIFMGVSTASVYDVMAFDPPLFNNDASVEDYKCQLVRNARSFFLTNPSPEPPCDFKSVPSRLAVLLSDAREPEPVSAG